MPWQCYIPSSSRLKAFWTHVWGDQELVPGGILFLAVQDLQQYKLMEIGRNTKLGSIDFSTFTTVVCVLRYLLSPLFYISETL